MCTALKLKLCLLLRENTRKEVQFMLSSWEKAYKGLVLNGDMTIIRVFHSKGEFVSPPWILNERIIPQSKGFTKATYGY